MPPTFNRLRAYSHYQAVQTFGSTALLIIDVMHKEIKLAPFLAFLVFFIPTVLMAEDMPPNAHKNIYGTGWECDRGFYRSGNGCSKVIIPKNGKLNIYGNGWECRRVMK